MNGVDERILERCGDAREPRATPRRPTCYEALAPTVVPTEDQTANTFTDKELTEEEEAEWNDLFEAVLGA